MINKATLIFVCLLFAFTCSQSCSSNCGACSTATNCTTCNSGYFLSRGSCSTCPPNCNACTFNSSSGALACTSCTAPAQLGADGRCFMCNPSCDNCTGVPTNCSSCPPGAILTMTNSSGTCGPDPGCPIANCYNCTLAFDNSTMCAICKPGYFQFNGGCAPCKFPCLGCSLNYTDLWVNVISTDFRTALGLALNVTPDSPPPGLPSVLNQFDFTTMNQSLQAGWIATFLGYKALERLVPVANVSSFVNDSLNFYLTVNISQSRDQIMTVLINRLNTVLGKTWTLATFTQLLAQTAANIAICDTCPARYALNTTANACENCPAHCGSCTGSACSSCDDGYFLSSTSCVACNATLCSTCDVTNSNCTACTPPLSLLMTGGSGSCVLCANPCATCTSNVSVCVTCKRPYSELANGTGVCFRCGQDVCTKCSDTNTSICLNCAPGYYINGNGSCTACSANCASCSDSLCLGCVEGFTLNNGTCQTCRAGCTTCSDRDSSICLVCNSGMYLDLATAQCGRCQAKCLECTGPQECTRFEGGIVLINGQVASCNPGCLQCSPTAPGVCVQCGPSFFPSASNAGLCQPCSPGCLTCSSASVCTVCMPFFLLNGGACVTCQGGCKECASATNLTTCTSCKFGLTLVNATCISQCATGCVNCAQNVSICQQCARGFALKADGTCVKCLSSCTGECDPRNVVTCLSCSNGFQLANNLCVRCPIGCTSCANGACTTCEVGFELKANAAGSIICAKKCTPPCSECNGATCTRCEPGNILTGGVCSPDTSCNPNCDFCPRGTLKESNGSCTRCQNNCASCLSPTSCVACAQGFWLNNGTCTACPDACTVCSSGSSCTGCSSGFVREILSMSTGIEDAVLSDQCIACSSNCLTCVTQPDKCTSCADGMQLMSSRCAGMFTVGFTYEISDNFTTFLQNSIIQNFLTSLATALGVSADDIYLTTVTSGSTVLRGAVSTANAQQAGTIQGSLGSPVPGFSVLSYSSVINYGDQPYTAPAQPAANNPAAATNVGMIVGVVIGSVAFVVIVIVMTYCLCKKKAGENESMRVKDESSEIQLSKKVGQ